MPLEQAPEVEHEINHNRNEFDGGGFSEDEQIWQCGCGCVAFHLTFKGEVVCAECKCDAIGIECRPWVSMPCALNFQPVPAN